MQCPNCGFQNMPGSGACGRCGTSLGLATAVLDVHPPRAGRATKRLRRVFGPARRATRAADEAVRVASAAVTRMSRYDLPPAPPTGVMARLVVPGWSHLYLKLRARGHLFLWAYLACLLPGLLLLGTLWGSVLLGLAFSVHSTAVLDVVTLTSDDCSLGRRLLRSFAVSAALGLLIYLPLGWLVTAVAGPRTIELAMGPFRAGDVVLVNDRAVPVPGDVALYDIPEAQTLMPGRSPPTYVQHTGERIDRVMAGPGDRVRWENNRLSVNGRPVPWRPLVPERVPPGLAFTVPSGHVLILPSTSPYLPPAADGAGGNRGLWQTLSCVPRSNVRGRVIARSHPLTRFEWFW